jgi:hypothetical protein
MVFPRLFSFPFHNSYLRTSILVRVWVDFCLNQEEFGMSRKIAVVVVLVMALAALPAPQAKALTLIDAQITLGCTSLSGNMHYDVNRDNTGEGREHHNLIVTDGAGTVLYEAEYHDGVPSTYNDTYNNTPYNIAPRYNPLYVVEISYAGNGYAEQTIYRSVQECEGLPGFIGEDMVPIPSTAVVGAVVSDTELYATPDLNSSIGLSLTAGKTVWVYGLDKSGQFYRIMLAGKFAWVPRGVMGPNYDAVWNGRPLPTDIVN